MRLSLLCVSIFFIQLLSGTYMAFGEAKRQLATLPEPLCALFVANTRHGYELADLVMGVDFNEEAGFERYIVKMPYSDSPLGNNHVLVPRLRAVEAASRAIELWHASKIAFIEFETPKRGIFMGDSNHWINRGIDFTERETELLYRIMQGHRFPMQGRSRRRFYFDRKGNRISNRRENLSKRAVAISFFPSERDFFSREQGRIDRRHILKITFPDHRYANHRRRGGPTDVISPVQVGIVVGNQIKQLQLLRDASDPWVHHYEMDPTFIPREGKWELVFFSF